MDNAILSYINTFDFSQKLGSFEELFLGEILLEMTNTVCEKHTEFLDFEIDTFTESSIIEGFGNIFSTIVKYFKEEHNLVVEKDDLGIDIYDIVTQKNRNQIFIIIKLILAVIIKEENDKWIEKMEELDEDEQVLMQALCEQAFELMNAFPEVEKHSLKNSKTCKFEDFSDEQPNSGLVDQKYIDNINDLNMTIESLDLEKRNLRIEIADEK